MENAQTGLGAPPAPVTDRERLRRLIAEKSLVTGDFTLASGRKSTFLFDMKKTMLDPVGINLLADAILEKVYLTDAAYVGGLAMGAVPMVVATVMKSHPNRELRGFWVRKEQKDHGTLNRADGYIIDGSKVVIVEDVTTTGSSVMKAVDEARDHNCEVCAVVTIVDRMEGARQFLSGQGIDLVAIFDRSDFGL